VLTSEVNAKNYYQLVIQALEKENVDPTFQPTKVFFASKFIKSQLGPIRRNLSKARNQSGSALGNSFKQHILEFWSAAPGASVPVRLLDRDNKDQYFIENFKCGKIPKGAPIISTSTHFCDYVKVLLTSKHEEGAVTIIKPTSKTF
jgi:hypothetical protein